MNAKTILFAVLAMPLLLVACDRKESTPAMPPAGSPQTTSPPPVTTPPAATTPPATTTEPAPPPSSTSPGGSTTTEGQGTK